MRVFGGLMAVVALACLGWLFAWPTGMSPVAYMTPPNPGFTGPYQRNAVLEDAVLIPLQQGRGPEDIVAYAAGEIATGLADGRIIGIDLEDPARQRLIADTGGRPNGLDLDAAGNLIVADNTHGLLLVDRSGEIEVLVDQFEGQELIFVNDVVVDNTGTIWFTDSSQRFPQPFVLMDYFEGRSTGRLFSYDPATGQTKKHLEAIRMANGLVLSPDEKSVLICETFGYQVIRYWISGDKAGTTEPFIENLPAFPDNISYDGKGTYWIGLISPRNEFMESLSDRPLMREALFRLTTLFGKVPEVEPFGWVVGADPEGRITHNFQDPSGTIPALTSANAVGGRLYLGSLEGDVIPVVDLLEE